MAVAPFTLATMSMPIFPLSSSELAKWESFAQRGGIGQAKALRDQEAVDADTDLMWLEGDEIIVLAADSKSDRFLGYCEEIIGCFMGDSVEFLGELRLPADDFRSHASPVVVEAGPTSPHHRPSRNSDNSVEVLSERADLKSQRRRTNIAGLGIDMDSIVTQEGQWKDEDAKLSPASPLTRGGDFVTVLSSASTNSLSRTPSLVTSPSSDFEDTSSTGNSIQTPPVHNWSPARRHDLTGPHLVTDSPQSSSNDPTETLPIDDFPLPAPRVVEESDADPRGNKTSQDSNTSSVHPFGLRLQSRFSDNSLATTRSRLKSFDDMPMPSSAFSSPSSQSPSFIRLPKTSDVSWRSLTNSSNSGGPGTPGTDGEDPTLAMIFDSYRYSTSSVSTVLRARSTTPESAMRKGARGRSLTPSGDTLSDSAMDVAIDPTGNELLSSPVRRQDPELEGSPFRFGAASDLRLQMRSGAGAPSSAQSPAEKLAAHRQSTDSFAGVIPRLSTIFPRSSTLDSLDSIRTASQGSNRSTDSPLPAVANDGLSREQDSSNAELEAARRLFDQHFVGPQVDASSGNEHAVLPDSPTRTRPPNTRRKSVKGLTISSPFVPSPVSGAASWRPPASLSPVNSASDCATFDVSTASPQSPRLVSGAFVRDDQPIRPIKTHYTATDYSRSFFDQADASQRLGPRPELTVTSDFHLHPQRAAPPSPAQLLSRTPSSRSSPASTFASGQSSPAISEQSTSGSIRREREWSASASPRDVSSNFSQAGKPGLKARTPAPLIISSPIHLDHQQPSSAPLTRQRDVSASPITPVSAPLPSSPRALNHKMSKGLLPFGRKSSGRSIADGDKAPLTATRMVGISSKDFEDETVRLQKVEFEIVKPMMRDVLASDSGSDGKSVSQLSTSASRPSLAISGLSHEDDTSEDTSHHFHGGFNVSTSASVRPVSMMMDAQTIENHRARELKWVKALSSMAPSSLRKNKKMRAMLLEGVPSSVRGRVWSYLAEVENVRVAGRYNDLCASARVPIDTMIETDVQQTLRDNPQLPLDAKARGELVILLKALFRHRPELGYCPATTFLGGLLLSQLGDGEVVFWTLVSLIERHDVKQFFPSGYEDLRVTTLAFGFLIEQTLPDIAQRFLELQIDPAIFTTKWLGTNFVPILPWKSVLRITDLVLLDSTYKLHAALAILELSRLDDAELFPTRESVVYFLLHGTIQAQGFTPVVLIPALQGLKLKEDRIKKAYKRAQDILRSK